MSLVEGVVRLHDRLGPDGHGDAVIDAARELCGLGPDLYKAEVPGLGRASPEATERAARQVSAATARPWVVLSAGVRPDDFPAAVEAACRGGASGFLAGRAVWAPAIAAEGATDANLAADARPRLERLVGIVDAAARPWREALGR